jgi:CRP/FNR family cyclic AMP-dependent transcriptional regulator
MHAARPGKSRSGKFSARTFLASVGLARKIVEYQQGDTIFSQGEPGNSVLYIQTGRVKLSVRSRRRQEAVVAMLGPGDFFGEGCLAGQPLRLGSATAITKSAILLIERNQMVKVLHQQHAMSDLFIAHMLSRNIRVEEDLLDQLFHSGEERLARALLLLARCGKSDETRAIPRISQATLAEIVGTTRSRVNVFMKKFQRLGFIEYKNGLTVNSSLLTVVLHDQRSHDQLSTAATSLPRLREKRGSSKRRRRKSPPRSR